MTLESGDRTKRKIAQLILALDIPLFIYALLLLRDQAETLTGPGAFNNATYLCLPVLWWGMGAAEREPGQQLYTALLCTVILLLTVSWTNHNTLLTVGALALLALGLVWATIDLRRKR